MPLHVTLEIQRQHTRHFLRRSFVCVNGEREEERREGRKEGEREGGKEERMKGGRDIRKEGGRKEGRTEEGCRKRRKESRERERLLQQPCWYNTLPRKNPLAELGGLSLCLYIFPPGCQVWHRSCDRHLLVCSIHSSTLSRSRYSLS